MRASAISLILISFAFAGDAHAKVLTIGKKAPDFRLRDQSQALFNFASFAAGHVVVMDFFRTDCKPCVKSLGALKKLHQAYRGKKVKVLMIALVEDDDGEAKLARFLKANPLPFTVLIDGYGTVAKKYISRANSVVLPSLFVIDKTQTVRFKHVSLINDAKEVTHAVDKHLK
jgi:peroxiredoxin